MALHSIVDEFVCGPEGIDPDCPFCDGTGTVCEDHPERPWHGTAGDEIGCPCHQAGMPCKDGRAYLAALDGSGKP
jgi:hypothetical protein